jgi:hypothetical protein
MSAPFKNYRKNVTWAPNPGSQELFIVSGQERSLVREVLYHGGRGIGKSEVLIVGFLQHVGKGWGKDWKGLIVRTEQKGLDDLVSKSKAIIQSSFIPAEFNETKKVWKFKTGEELKLGFCKTVEDYNQRYHGHEYTYLGFDELTTWKDSTVFQSLQSTLRNSFKPNKIQSQPPPEQVRATTNPYGPGKGWVKEYFIDVTPAGVPLFKNGRMQRMHVKGFIRENNYIKKSYIEDFLEEIINPVLRAAWFYGDWNSVDHTSIFGSLWSTHLELEPFQIPSNWKVYRTFDFGQSTPFATVWTAEANGEEVVLKDGSKFCPPAGSLIVIGEDYGTEEDANGKQTQRNAGLFLTARQIAKRILEKEKRLKEYILEFSKPLPGPADNQIFNGSRMDQGQAPTVAREMEAEGLRWLQSDKSPGSRRNSAQIMVERLDATREQDPERPHIYIFNSCRYCLKFLPDLSRDDADPDCVAKGQDDHLWDALAYRLTMKKPRVMKSFTQSVTGRRY